MCVRILQCRGWSRSSDRNKPDISLSTTHWATWTRRFTCVMCFCHQKCHGKCGRRSGAVWSWSRRNTGRNTPFSTTTSQGRLTASTFAFMMSQVRRSSKFLDTSQWTLTQRMCSRSGICSRHMGCKCLSSGLSKHVSHLATTFSTFLGRECLPSIPSGAMSNP